MYIASLTPLHLVYAGVRYTVKCSHKSLRYRLTDKNDDGEFNFITITYYSKWQTLPLLIGLQGPLQTLTTVWEVITFKPGEQTQQRHSILVSCLLKKRYSIGYCLVLVQTKMIGLLEAILMILRDTYFFQILRLNHLTPFGDFKDGRFNL